MYKFIILNLISLMGFATPPIWVYRFDTRAPEEIFQFGFSARGGNDNVEQHVSGFSLRNQIGSESASAFIATTASQASVNRWMPVAMVQNAGYSNRMWVYTIRATSNFIDINRILENTERVDPSARTRRNANILLARYGDQDEWAALDNISYQQVFTAVEYRYESLLLQALPTGNSRVNARYRFDTTRGSDDLYPIHGNRHQDDNAGGMSSLGDYMVPALLLAWCSSKPRVVNKCDLPDEMSFEYFESHIIWCPAPGIGDCINKDNPYKRNYISISPQALLLGE